MIPVIRANIPESVIVVGTPEFDPYETIKEDDLTLSGRWVREVIRGKDPADIPIPAELLEKTVNGCKHLRYPDQNKVHIWVCDDNRRPEMRALAVGYFDRPDHEGAKAGNLNHALARTSAPYVVTLDADMIPKSDFLMKTIPYFVDVELRMEGEEEQRKKHLGFLQTPQAFYTPDIFQHALYDRFPG